MRNARILVTTGLAATLLLALLVTPVAGPVRADDAEAGGSYPLAAPGHDGSGPVPLWTARDPEFQLELEVALGQAGLGGALGKRVLSVALADITNPKRPRVAAINGDVTFYAASLPKIAVMLAVFEKAELGTLEIDEETRRQLYRMIRISSNSDSTALMQKAGKQYIAEVLRSPRYRLYDESRGGGLWAGKDYASGGLWRRDPMHKLSHAATAMQAVRFFYLLARGRLVSTDASLEMKQILRREGGTKKFLAGFGRACPGARVYRKGGTWRNFHSDAAMVERQDGAVFIVAALSESEHGRKWMEMIAEAVDGLVPPPR